MCQHNMNVNFQTLIPKLKAKPIRTASGVSFMIQSLCICLEKFSDFYFKANAVVACFFYCLVFLLGIVLNVLSMSGKRDLD